MKSLVSNFWGLEWVLSKSGHEFTVPLLLPNTPQASAEAHNLEKVNFSYSLIPIISFSKTSLERPRGRQNELKGPGTKGILGWMHFWMIFCLVLKSTGKDEDVPLHFMCPSRFSGEMEWSSPHALELELTCAELKRLFLSPHMTSEVVSFVFKAVHHSCYIWRDPASATQQAQKMAPAELAVMLLKAFFPHRKMEIQVQAFTAK